MTEALTALRVKLKAHPLITVQPLAEWPKPSLAALAVVALLLIPWLAFTRVANPGPVTGRVFVETPQYLFTVAGLAVLGALRFQFFL